MTERTVDWPSELVEQAEFYWNVQFRPRLDGLTDDEYLWEPCAGCWSIRVEPDGTAVAEHEEPEPEPAPFTTIAWRLGHIATGVLGSRAYNHFADHGGTFDRTHVAGPATATAGIGAVDAAYAAWMSGVRALGEEGMAAACGPAEGPYAEHSMAALVLHISRELIHHGAEVLCLRDLYRCTGGRRIA